jgi:hypothetical protein
MSKGRFKKRRDREREWERHEARRVWLTSKDLEDIDLIGVALLECATLEDPGIAAHFASIGDLLVANIVRLDLERSDSSAVNLAVRVACELVAEEHRDDGFGCACCWEYRHPDREPHFYRRSETPDVYGRTYSDDIDEMKRHILTVLAARVRIDPRFRAAGNALLSYQERHDLMPRQVFE